MAADLENPSHYTSGFVTLIEDTTAAFIGAIQTTGLVSSNDLTHVNLSYYKGFTNITNSSGRERAVPTYRATALHDLVSGYATKVILGSQRRRRTSTTP